VRCLAVIAVTIACTGGTERSTERRPSTPVAPTAEVARDASVARVADHGPPLSETEARAMLSERFRRAGLRVRQDVRVRGESYDVTLDGYDPDRDIGFEYIAVSERGTDLDDAERAALASKRILILDASSEQTVSAAADAFLASLADAGP